MTDRPPKEKRIGLYAAAARAAQDLLRVVTEERSTLNQTPTRDRLTTAALELERRLDAIR